MNADQIAESLNKLQKQLDEVLIILQELQGKKRTQLAAKRGKAKPEPLSEADISEYKEQFISLYERWLGGDEVGVQSELENLDADTLRRFADANNLNVTTKTPKPKSLQLIAARFREKRQLTKETPRLINTKIEEIPQQEHPSDSEK